ncbi:MAG: phenylalanine--tRNA ligase subunit alpha [Bacillota bacterium]
MEFRRNVDQILQRALTEIEGASDEEELEDIRIKYLGREGSLTALLRGIGDLPSGERAEAGRVANEAKKALQHSLEEAQETVASGDHGPAVDVTAPGVPVDRGARHPLRLVLDEVLDIFVAMGYAVADGPEVEQEWFNFTGLNIPQDHPARDMQDSYYVGEDLVLRSQTSPIQLRYMLEHAPRLPVRIVGPGRTYRRDTEDPSHSPVFHQCEALLVDRDITMGHLRGTLTEFARRLFGDEVEVRFRPSYFPFTEPSAEVDVTCTSCWGSGCPTCGGQGFLEILGAGMVHPRVLANGGYDPDEVSGFAFGMGIERLTMIKYGIDDLRSLYRNDLRFLEQFGGGLR